MDDLFGHEALPAREVLSEGAVWLRGRALADEAGLLAAITGLLRAAPARRMLTPGGRAMSVGISNCGGLGWISDRRGYRYAGADPASGRPWPAMPEALVRLATLAADEAGFADFHPDACLINCYVPGAGVSLHQDRNERDMTQPIVSVSLGLPAIFLFGGMSRSDRPLRLPLRHGDVLVWGGPDRLRFHGVHPVAPGRHPLLGSLRVNLTFRRAG
ncbi:MAG: DNA oxidative demethylase AlkB [Perlucidibaca sp.]